MKKSILVALLFPLCAAAQRSMQHYYQMNMLNYGSEYFYEDRSISLKIRKETGMKSINTTTTRKNGKQSQSQSSYNRTGKLIHSESKYQTIDNVYESDTLLTASTKTRKNKVYETNSTYEKGKLSTRKIYKNGKLQDETELKYNVFGKVASTQLTKGRKKFEIQYSYNEEGKLSRSAYLINGKLKKEWLYECKPEGQVVASKTEELSSICTYREESADGSYTTFTRSLREGKPYLFKQTFSKDSVMIASQQFRNDTILIWESHKENNIETTVGYRKNGKRRYTQISVFNEKGGLLSQEYVQGNKQKKSRKSVFELNSDGTTKTRQYYWKGKLDNTTEFEYTFF